MKLKLTLLASLFLLLTCTAYAQTYRKNIEKDFKHLNDLMMSGKYEEAVELFPKRIFEVASKEQLITAFEQLLNNPDFKTAVMDYKILDISLPEKIDSAYYATVKYSTTITMSFTPPENENLDARTDRLQRIKFGLSNTFGSGQVTLDENTGKFTLTPVKKSYAISTNGENNWQFVNVEPAQRVVMEKILPKKILDRELN